MAQTLTHLLHHLRRLAPAPGPDADLLNAFVRQRDEAAFTALVARHGPLVLHVCRRVLGDSHAAEDCFQAVFLVLAKRAGSLRQPAALAGWLYGVALRVAWKARSAAGQRGHGQVTAPEPAGREADPLAQLTARELLAAVDEELQRLPAAYQLPVLLCCLEGKSQEEAARQLGWTPGSVKGRLERGRKRLHARLAQRGLTLPAALAAVEFSRGAVSAGLVGTTARAALAFARVADGVGSISAEILALAEAGLGSLAVARVKMGVLALLTLGLLAVGAGVAAYQARQAAEPNPPAKAAPPAGRAEAKRARTDALGDPLPPGALARLGTTRLRHPGYVYQVSFTPDSKALVTAGDGGARLWDLATCRELRLFPVPALYNNTAALAPDGKTLANAGLKQAICLWDLGTGKELRQFGDENDSPYRLLWTPDGRTLVAVPNRDMKMVCLWDVATGQVRHRVPFHAGEIHTVAVSPVSGTVAVTCWKDRVIHLLDPATGQAVGQFRGHRQEACSVAWAPDGKTLASSANDGTVRLWEPATGKERWRKENLAGGALLAFAPDGKTLAVGADGTGVPRLWDAGTGKERRRFDGPGQHSQAFLFAPDGRTLAAEPNGEHAPLLWDVATGKRLHFVNGHQTDVRALSFAADSGRLLSSGGGGFLWDTASWKLVPGKRELGSPAVFSPDGKYLAVRGVYRDKGSLNFHTQIELRDSLTGTIIHRLRGLTAVGVASLAFAADGNTLVATTSHSRAPNTVHVWDVPTGKEVGRFKWESNDQHTPPAVSPDGKLLAVVAGRNGTVALLDARTGKELRRLNGHKGTPGALAFSPDGKTLVSAGPFDHAVHLWAPATGQELGRFESQQGSSAAIFSADGRSLATAATDIAVQLWEAATVRVWEVATRRQRCQFAGHIARVNALAFSPDGSVLVSGGSDTTILAWDVVGRFGDPAAEVAGPAPGEGQRLWAELGSEDAAVAYRAMCRIMETRHECLSLLKGNLAPAAVADTRQRQQIERLIADLDSKQFTIRERAAQALEQAGTLAEPALRRALAGQPSLESRRRLEALLRKRDEPAAVSARLQVMRAIEVLERLGSPEARALLRTLADGAAGAEQTRKARASLERLNRRAAAGP